MLKQLRNLLLTAGIIFMSLLASGQGVTTANMSGKVTDQNGGILPGATIVAVHVPSGTTYGTTTGTNGVYFMPSMRVGGPYKVTISFVGYKDAVYDDVYLNLGTTFNLDAQLSEAQVEIQEVVVTGVRSNVFSSDRTGAATSITREYITALPTINRSINDFTKLTPQASGRSFVGQDARLNNITIDGSIFNNSFGLADQPGGRTGTAPISLDAIEEIQVSIAPFDVRQAGFVGAGVNAVTKSGTNDFSGSAFYTVRNQSWIGDKAHGVDVNSQDFNVAQYGFRLGGPIIKNKLFFFVNGEFESDVRPATSYRANLGGETVGGNITRVLKSDLDNLSSYLKEKFNYETGPYQGYNNEMRGNKFLVKLDYNISNNHKFSIRYNWLDSQTDVLCSNSSSLGFGNRRTNTQALNYQNSNYIQKEIIHSVIGELNSTFGRFSNNLIIGYTYQNEDRGSRGDFFPLVEIQNASTTYITFGFEPFTPNNLLSYKTYQLQNNLTYFAGNHTVTAGFNLERFTFRNVFFPGSQSVYVYNSLADWYNDADDYIANPNRTVSPVTLRRFQLRYSALPGGAEPVQPTRVTYAGAYIQDQFTPLKGLKVTAGIRVDVPIFDNTGFKNETVAGQTFIDRKGQPYKINTDKLPDPKLLYSPRLGFNYDVTGDRKIQLRGGTGLFTGRPAFVWISNQIGNNGVLTGFIQTDNTTAYPFNPDPAHYIPATPTLPSSYELAITDPDFKFPQTWRSNIATDIKLPFGFLSTLEFIYNQEVNGIGYFNANLPLSNNVVYRPGGVIERPRYTSTRINSNVVNAITLDNSNNGYGYSLAASLEKPFANGFFVKAAYNFGVSKNTVDPGSIAAGSYNNNLIYWDPNNAYLSYSNNDQRHRFIFAASYKLEYKKFGSTQIGLFLEGRNQGRTSYYYSNDLNGDGNTNDLLYIHKNMSEMNFVSYDPDGTAGPAPTYTAADQAADWELYIKQDKYLNANRGKFAERNGVIFPWIWSADLNITQEFYIYTGGKRNVLQFTMNIINVTNLINSDWGVGWVINSNRPIRVVNATANPATYRLNTLGVKTDGTIVKITDTFSRSASLGDVWSAQFGIRYIFN